MGYETNNKYSNLERKYSLISQFITCLGRCALSDPIFCDTNYCRVSKKYKLLNSSYEGALIPKMFIFSLRYRRDSNLNFATSYVQIGLVFAE